VKRVVPVTLGSPDSRHAEVGPFLVTEAWFPPGLRIPPHTHERACIAVMLDGAFDLAIAGRDHECSPGTMVTEPACERHANRISLAGAHVVVVQPDPAAAETFEPLATLLDEPAIRTHARIADLARRIRGELREPDAVSALAIESLAMEMLVLAHREARVHRGAAPRWLSTLQEYLHAHYREGFDLRSLADVAGVHPVHVTRAFRARFRVSIGDYVRGLRLSWAAERLVASEQPIADIALEAGFSDQSHLTRWFRRQTGLTPGSYRAARRPRSASSPRRPRASARPD
jgi:AraC family transcriptional regulator